jgi:N-acetylmuramoyl-L-alanine amidase
MKNKILLGTLSVVLALTVLTCLGFASDYFGKTNKFATAFFAMGISVRELVVKYTEAPTNGKIKILIVPGHEPNFGGAEYKNLLERDLNLQLSERLQNDLIKNPRFEITLARDKNGWNKSIENYISKNQTYIKKWVSSKKTDMLRLIDNGKLRLISPIVDHTTVPPQSAIFLYGINKWAAENKIDIVLHVHFNDNPKYKGEPSYEGFSIYVPERQYSNSISSKVFADNLLEEISKIENTSTMPQENPGVIEDQDLIAIGRYNTSDSLSALVEYAYIYEPFMQNPELRNNFIDDAASSTARAIRNFFESRTMFLN